MVRILHIGQKVAVQKVANDYSTKTYYRIEGCYFDSHGVQLTNRKIRKFSTILKIEIKKQSLFDKCFNWECEIDRCDDATVEKRIILYGSAIDFTSFVSI